MQNDESTPSADCPDCLEKNSWAIETPTRTDAADAIEFPPSELNESKSTFTPNESKSTLAAQSPRIVGSPRSYAPCAHTHKLIHARLFKGGSMAAFSPPSRKGQSDPEAVERLLAFSSPRNKPEPPLHPEYTFMPQISSSSKKMDKDRSGEREGARWEILSSQHTDNQNDKKKKMEKMIEIQKEKEMQDCTFHPQLNNKSHRIVSENKGKLKRYHDPSEKHGPIDNGDSRIDNKNETKKKSFGASKTAPPRRQPGYSTEDSLESTSGSPTFGDPVFNDLHRMLRSLQL